MNEMPLNNSQEPAVLIVGGGLAGLCCARELHRRGLACQILEATDDVGGRVRTDRIDGFLCDHGFQVLLTAYPEAQSVLDYDALQLARFQPGALIRYKGRFHRFADPWRQPRHALATILSPIASLPEKWRVGRLRRDLCQADLPSLYERPEQTTIDRLHRAGFSSALLDRFFRPFMGGVFLERELNTSSRKFDFLFRMFATGQAAVPARGMGMIARQIADRLPPGTIRTGTPVERALPDGVRLASGQRLPASAVVVAADGASAGPLLGEPDSTPWHGVTCLYFAADQSPVPQPVLVLNGDGKGPINNLCVPSEVSPDYAPDGQALISVSVLGVVPADRQETLQGQVLGQLHDWFGGTVDRWRHLKTYRIPRALPDQSPPRLSPVSKPVRRPDGILVCGDHRHTASIQGAMLSGRLAAEAIPENR